MTRIKYLLIVFGLVLALWGINYPYVGTYNANNNYLSLAAKNYLRFGFTRLRFLPTYFAGAHVPEPIPYYLHHPVLIFPLSAVPFILFGFRNWVVHGTNFLFLLGDVFLIYAIGARVWNKKVGLWAAGLAAIFPMTGFFWKYIFFEQGSLFFNLLVYYFFIRYLKKQNTMNLLAIFLFTFLSGLIDWGVLYLLLPFSIFFFSRYRKTSVVPFGAYLAGAGISLAFFVWLVYAAQHGFVLLATAVGVRAISNELFLLPLWPIRLFVISILRIGIYFSPFVFFAAWLAIRRKMHDEQKLLLGSFLLFGLLNVVFLPTATWGHSYFLFYLIPFFAYCGAIWMTEHEHTPRLIVGVTVGIIVWSVLVSYFKLQQVTKQAWKYDAAALINKSLSSYETIGVVDFPGDVFEQYFLHPTQPMTPEEFSEWRKGRIYPEVARSVIVQGNTARLVTRDDPYSVEKASVKNPSSSPVLRIYRFIRDILNVGQI